ncbi:MAG: hypothetical protein ACOCYO_06435 [Bacteroidota bacterium]
MKTQLTKNMQSEKTSFFNAARIIAAVIFIQLFAISYVMADNMGESNPTEGQEINLSMTTPQGEVPSDALAISGTNDLVRFLSLSYQIKNSIVELKWTTTNLTGEVLFVVQRSYDGHNFENISKVNGNEGGNYIFSDRMNIRGVCYYRIMQVSETGGISFSETIEVLRSEFYHEMLPDNRRSAG